MCSDLLTTVSVVYNKFRLPSRQGPDDTLMSGALGTSMEDDMAKFAQAPPKLGQPTSNKKREAPFDEVEDQAKPEKTKETPAAATLQIPGMKDQAKTEKTKETPAAATPQTPKSIEEALTEMLAQANQDLAAAKQFGRTIHPIGPRAETTTKTKRKRKLTQIKPSEDETDSNINVRGKKTKRSTGAKSAQEKAKTKGRQKRRQKRRRRRKTKQKTRLRFTMKRWKILSTTSRHE